MEIGQNSAKSLESAFDTPNLLLTFVPQSKTKQTMKKFPILLTESELKAIQSSLQTAATNYENRYCRECDLTTFENPHKNALERLNEIAELAGHNNVAMNPQYHLELNSLLQSTIEIRGTDWYITDIKRIIDKHGTIYIDDLSTKFSPTVVRDDFTRTVAEIFYEDGIEAVTYDNGCNAQIAESHLKYDQLDEDTLSEIHEELYCFDVDMEKTMGRCCG